MRLPLWIIAGVLGLLLIAYATYALLRTPATSTTPDTSTTAQAPSPQGLAAFDLDGDGIVYQDPMHPWIVQDAPGKAPDCGMDLVPVSVHEALNQEAEGTVRIDPVMLQNFGVRLTTVEVAPLAPTVRTTARLEVNEQQLVAVSPKIEGWVERLYVNYEGARVRKGDPLLELYSPALVSTQEEYLLALRNVQQLAGTPAQTDAQRLLEAARRRLLFWDITAEQIRQLETSGQARKTLTLYAPASGTVLRKEVVEGQQVQPGQTLFVLADLSTLWLQVDVYEHDLSWIKPGITAEITLPYDPTVRLQGRVDYIYDTLNPETRTARARIVVPNPGLRLKPGMYALATLQGQPTPPRPRIPTEALVRYGAEAWVILALGEGRFRPVRVQPGLEAQGYVQILEGLQGDEQIVARAQFLIDSEARLKQALAAFMGGHQHGATPAPETQLQPSPRAPEHQEHGTSPAPKTQPQPLPRMPEHQGHSANQDTTVVSLRIDANGFVPSRIEVPSGRPVRLTVTRTTDQTCATAIQFPELGIGPVDLPLHQPVTLTFTPARAGAYLFTCGMNMLKGTLLVHAN
uniref:Efflux RND transporter periplasmic adaptor subunit n=1 Tax=Rhodothermus marinus TaxID=29549 RepID=A0A7V2B2N3_RHOMR